MNTKKICLLYVIFVLSAVSLCFADAESDLEQAKTYFKHKQYG